MNKIRLALVSALALSLAATNTALAKSSEKQDDHPKHKTGLEYALKNVQNVKAREALKRAMEREDEREFEWEYEHEHEHGKDKEKYKYKNKELKTAAQIVAADKATLLVGFGGNDTAASVTQALKMKTTGKYGSTITWSSSNTAVISNNGKIVIRPANADVKVVLTATIRMYAVTAIVKFEVIVKAQLTDAQMVAADKAALGIGFSGSDHAGSVTSPLNLAARGAYGSSITWVSSAPSIISNDGKIVNRPTAAQGNVTVTLVATISRNGVVDTKWFTLIVKSRVSDAEKVAADKAALSIGYTSGDSAASVTGKLTLPSTGPNGSAITWISASPAIVSHDGKTVNRPAYGQGDVTVVLVATISSSTVSDVKSFTVVVKQQWNTDAQKVAADKAALQIGFSGWDTAASVTGRLALPTVGVNGSIIVWYSSNASVITDNGIVIRPAAGTGDKTVTVTAIVVNNTAFESKAFTVTVKQLP